MTRTDEFFNLTVTLEGGFSNRVEDKGGKTKYGITQNCLDTYNIKHALSSEEVINLTIDKAKEIYTEFYYFAVRPFPNKEIHFNFVDVAYNSGNKHYIELKNSVGENPTVENIYTWRTQFYNKLDQPANIKGWLDRIKLIKSYFNNEVA